MCETRDLGMKWPRWHTLVLRNEITIDMRFVQRMPKRCWYRGLDQKIGRSGQPSTSMKSYNKEHGWIQGRLSCERK